MYVLLYVSEVAETLCYLLVGTSEHAAQTIEVIIFLARQNCMLMVKVFRIVPEFIILRPQYAEFIT